MKPLPQLRQKAGLADSWRLQKSLSDVLIIDGEAFSPPLVHPDYLHEEGTVHTHYLMQFLACLLELQGGGGRRRGSDDYVIEGELGVEGIKLVVFDRYYIFSHHFIKDYKGTRIHAFGGLIFHPRLKKRVEEVRGKWIVIFGRCGRWAWQSHWLLVFSNKHTTFPFCPFLQQNPTLLPQIFQMTKSHTNQQFFLIQSTLLPLNSTSLNVFATSLPTISLTSVSRMFMVPSKLLSVPLKKVSLSLSLTSTGRPRSCLMKSAGLPFLLIIIYTRLKLILICYIRQMFGALLETLLLFVNAIAILNEKRFLKKYGFSTIPVASGAQNSPNENLTSKSQIIMLMFSLRSFGRYFLIVLNVIAIAMEVLG